MIFNEFIHIGIGDTGEGIIRHAIATNILTKKVLKRVNTDAHRPLSFSRTLSDAPAFTSIRNPLDWYISRWIHHLKNHKYFGGFREWFLDKKPCMKDTWDYYTQPEGIPFKQVIRFENVEDDFARILPAICPIITKEQVHSWFPDCFRQWTSRTWSENIEQWMRKELYTNDVLDIVFEQDAELFHTWNYHFDDYYVTHKGHLG